MGFTSGVPLRLLLVVAFASSCATGRPPSIALPPPRATTPPPPSQAPGVEITLEHMPSADAWRATYRFAEPVHSARFVRAEYDLRPLHWRVVQPRGARIERVASATETEPQVRLSSDDGPFRE